MGSIISATASRRAWILACNWSTARLAVVLYRAGTTAWTAAAKAAKVKVQEIDRANRPCCAQVWPTLAGCFVKTLPIAINRS